MSGTSPHSNPIYLKTIFPSVTLLTKGFTKGMISREDGCTKGGSQSEDPSVYSECMGDGRTNKGSRPYKLSCLFGSESSEWCITLGRDPDRETTHVLCVSVPRLPKHRGYGPFLPRGVGVVL